MVGEQGTTAISVVWLFFFCFFQRRRWCARMRRMEHGGCLNGMRWKGCMMKLIDETVVPAQHMEA